jgi:hypothetical protein
MDMVLYKLFIYTWYINGHAYNNKSIKLDNQYPSYLWNCKLDHINKTKIIKLYKERYFDHFDYESYKTYKACLLGEMTKTPFTGKSEKSNKLLALMHTCVYGLIMIHVISVYTYFITFTNDHSRYGLCVFDEV